MKLPGFIAEGVSLARATSMRVGGAARFFAQPRDIDEIVRTREFARERGLRLFLLGGGSNVIASDAGFDGVVVRLDSKGLFGSLERSKDNPLAWRAGAAVPLARLVAESARCGAAGLESLAGIPGTAGGAAAMNAGSADLGFGAFVASGVAVDPDGTVRRLEQSDMGFAYRRSGLGESILVELELRLLRLENPEDVLERAKAYREAKAASQPLDLPSSGCVFKNPEGDAAGRLLDLAGCKGMAEGGAEVSAKHANFIVNAGEATASGIARLAERMRRAVLERFGVGLDMEIRILS